MNALHIVSGDKTLMSQTAPGNIITHLLLIHNWFPRWAFEINGTHWSVAAEWQIYFLFPLLLLPIWRKFGGPVLVSAGLILSILPFVLLPPSLDLHWTCPQYIGLFALGMMAATVNFPQKMIEKKLHDALPWGVVSGITFCIFLLSAKFLTRGFQPDGQLAVRQPWTMDVLIGIAAASFIVCCTKRLTDQQGQKNYGCCGFLSRAGQPGWDYFLTAST